MRPLSFAVVAAAVLLCASSAQAQNAACSNLCRFSSSDPPTCKVLGQFERKLIAWPKCSQSCLDAFNIKIATVPETRLKTMFPDPTGAVLYASQVPAWVNFLTKDSTSIGKSMRLSFSNFYLDNNGQAKLRSSISTSVGSCNSDVDEKACYALMEKYFLGPGKRDMQKSGEILWQQVALAKEIEQGVCRIRMCNVKRGLDEDKGAQSKCAAVYNEVAPRESSVLGCSAFGFGPSGGTLSTTDSQAAICGISTDRTDTLTDASNNDGSDGSSSTTNPLCTNACQFTDNDDSACTVVGQFQGQLVTWSKCTQTCLDGFNIKVEGVSTSLLERMFPNRNGDINPQTENEQISAFANFLRLDGSSTANSARAAFPDFFEDQGGILRLRSFVSTSVGTADCSVSASSCTELLRIYLAGPGKQTMQQIGDTLWLQSNLENEIEQSVCRIRMCNIQRGIDGGQQDAIAKCYAPYTEVGNALAVTNVFGCSSFGFGPGVSVDSLKTSTDTHTAICGLGAGHTVHASLLLTTALVILAVLAA